MKSKDDMRVRADKRILVVQGRGALGDRVTNPLSDACFEIEVLSEQSAAFQRIRERRFDAILLDMTLAGVNGEALCRAIRLVGANQTTPLLMIAAESHESDRVRGLGSGADDYLSSPFADEHLIARMAAILRR
jgi:two-component system phosphate regulon response regulator PhoB